MCLRKNLLPQDKITNLLSVETLSLVGIDLLQVLQAETKVVQEVTGEGNSIRGVNKDTDDVFQILPIDFSRIQDFLYFLTVGYELVVGQSQ